MRITAVVSVVLSFGLLSSAFPVFGDSGTERRSPVETRETQPMPEIAVGARSEALADATFDR